MMLKAGRPIILSFLFEKRYEHIFCIGPTISLISSFSQKDAYGCPLTLGSTLCLQGFMLVFITTILYCKSFRLVHESTALVIPRITAWDPPFPCSRLGDFSSDHECRPYAWRCDHIYKHGTRPKIELRNSIAFRKLHSWSEERWNREERWITAVHCVNLKSPELKLE